MTQRTRRIVRLVVGLFVPHTVVVLVQRMRSRRRAPGLVVRPVAGARTPRPFAYEDAVSLLVARGVDEDVVRLGSIGARSLAFAAEAIGKHAPPGPLRVLHVGNFVGLSLAALSDVVVRHDPGSVVVSIDPNRTHLGVEDPQSHVLALLNEFGLQRGNVVVCGYTFEGSADGPAGEDTLPDLERLGQRFDLAVIDGNHDTAYLRRELEVVVRMLEDGGLLILDDVSHAYQGIRELFDELVAGDAWPLRKVGRDERLGVLRKAR